MIIDTILYIHSIRSFSWSSLRSIQQTEWLNDLEYKWSVDTHFRYLILVTYWTAYTIFLYFFRFPTMSILSSLYWICPHHFMSVWNRFSDLIQSVCIQFECLIHQVKALNKTYRTVQVPRQKDAAIWSTTSSNIPNMQFAKRKVNINQQRDRVNKWNLHSLNILK